MRLACAEVFEEVQGETGCGLGTPCRATLREREPKQALCLVVEEEAACVATAIGACPDWSELAPAPAPTGDFAAPAPAPEGSRCAFPPASYILPGAPKREGACPVNLHRLLPRCALLVQRRVHRAVVPCRLVCVLRGDLLLARVWSPSDVLHDGTALTYAHAACNQSSKASCCVQRRPRSATWSARSAPRPSVPTTRRSAG